ncbi:MAG TPA: hypothetical protein VG722_13930 [Tepidisphaeraceae bacterium]|nr:hypothetical protein [Tepidisphaeraceae bacterium]
MRLTVRLSEEDTRIVEELRRDGLVVEDFLRRELAKAHRKYCKWRYASKEQARSQKSETKNATQINADKRR